ncbi:hypothetical protein ACLKA6_010098 [Drosophila palustris]
MAKRVRFKLSDLSDEQLLELFESVPSDGELSSISSDDEDDDFNVVEALTDALEDADTVSFIDSNAENVPNNSQEPEPSRKTRKRPRSPLPIIEDSACIPLPTSGGFNGVEMAKRVRFKLSDLSDEQLLELFESVPSDGELSSISSDDEDDDFNVVEALTDALEDADTVSFIDSNAENVPNNSQEPEPSRKTRKRPRSPLPIIEDSACIPLPTSGGFNGVGKKIPFRNEIPFPQ